MNWTARIELYLAEGRTISGGKGDQTIKNQETANANFSNTLMNAFKSQFRAQQGVLSFLQGKLTSGVNNPQGFDQKTLTALNTGAIGQSATDYQNALRTSQERGAAHGSAFGLPSGVQAQIEGQLAGQQAGSESTALNQIQLANENQKQTNYWNSVQGLSGVAGQMNPLGYAGQATGAGSSVGDLGTAYKNSQSSQLLGALGGLAGGVGSALGGYYGGKP